MPKISEIDWNELLGSQKEYQRLRKDQMIKFVASFVVLLSASIYSFVSGNEQGQFLSYIIPFSIIGIITTYMAKSARAINLIIFILMYVFMGLIASYSIFVKADSPGLIMFFVLMVLYFAELEKKCTNKQWIIAFSVYCLSLALLLPFLLEIKLTLIVITILIGAYTYSGNDARAEIVSLKRQQESYAIYQRHQKILEHNVINSVSKLKYIEERIKRLKPEEHEELKELSDLMNEELAAIQDTIMNTDKDNLKNFNI